MLRCTMESHVDTCQLALVNEQISTPGDSQSPMLAPNNAQSKKKTYLVTTNVDHYESEGVQGQSTKTPKTEKTVDNNRKALAECASNLMEDLLNILECPVCWNHMVAPILLCERGHSICFKCRPFMTKCPLCRNSFLLTRNVSLELVAQKLGLSVTDEESFQISVEKNFKKYVNQVTFSCPLTLYTHCYWQGNYSDIKAHMEEIHENKILTDITNSCWEVKLLVKDIKVIFTLNEIFLYKERLDTVNSKFFIQIFNLLEENNTKFSYLFEMFSEFKKEKFVVEKKTLPINDLEHNYTFSCSNCIVIDYKIVSDMSKHGDLKCSIKIFRSLQE